MAKAHKEASAVTGFKALTYLHLPVIEKDFKPGDPVSAEELEAAEQSQESIDAMVAAGTLGGEDDDIHPSHIIPDPSMPTIGSVVENSRRLIAQLEATGEEVPDELRTVAQLDYTALATGDEGKSGDANV